MICLMPIGLILTSSIMCTWNELFILLLINMHLKVHLSTHNKPAPWIDATTKKLMYERDIFKKRVARSNSQADWMNYKTARNRTNYEQDACSGVHTGLCGW